MTINGELAQLAPKQNAWTLFQERREREAFRRAHIVGQVLVEDKANTLAALTDQNLELLAGKSRPRLGVI